MFSRFTACCVLVVSAAALLSCGGGGGGSPSDQAAGGIWLGEWTGGEGGIEGALAFSTDIDTDSGLAQMSMILIPSRIQIAGTLKVDGTRFAGSGTAFAPPGDSFPDGASTTSLTFSGTLREGEFVRGDWSIDSGESGSFDLEYDAQHLRGADVARLDGDWTLCGLEDSAEVCPNPMGSFNILNGMIFRQTEDCTSMGWVTVPDPALNMYVWNATVRSITPGSCFIEGDYSGLGALTDSDDESPAALNDEFDVLVNSDALAFPLLLVLEP